MRLSVIIPVYNVASFLKECLDSVFSQELDALEVICVDDGSTDSSGDILDEYRRIHSEMTLISQANAGQSCARNAGLDAATGDYVCFLDSDDYLLQGSLKGMLDFAVSHDLDMACFNVTTGADSCYFPTGFDIAKCSAPSFVRAFYRHTGRYYGTPVWLYLYKMSFLRSHKLRFVPGRLHEDNEFIGRALFLAHTCALRNMPVQFHRLNRNGSIMASVSEKRYVCRLQNFRDLFAFYGKHKLKSPFLEAQICHFLSLISDVRHSGLSMRSLGFKISDFLKFVVLSPFYLMVLYRRMTRRLGKKK